MRNNAEGLEKQIVQGTTPGCRKRGRPKTAWMDNILQWTGYSLDKILLDTEERGRWRQLVHGVVKPRSEDILRQGKTGKIGPKLLLTTNRSCIYAYSIGTKISDLG